MKIIDLTDRPDLVDIVADRIWNAWWRSNDFSFEAIRERVKESLGDDPIPSCLVVLSDGAFAGTVSLIENDMEARPQYTPWLAALWVEPSRRGQGIARKLVRALTDFASATGVETLHLCATPENSPLYSKLGWSLLEADVDDLNIFVAQPGR